MTPETSYSESLYLEESPGARLSVAVRSTGRNCL
jgi:hypothetical protein